MTLHWTSTPASPAGDGPRARSLSLVPQPADRTAGGKTHYRHGELDETTLAGISALIFRITKRPLGASIALALWADEVVVTRDDSGRVLSAHGFRFTDLPVAEETCRLVYAAFSVSDISAPRAGTDELFGHVFEREKARHSSGVVVWVNAPSCDREPKVSTGGPGLRRLLVSPPSQLPLNLRIFTDRASLHGAETHVSREIDAAATALLHRQRDLEHQARLGRVGPVPHSRAMSAAVGSLARAG